MTTINRLGLTKLFLWMEADRYQTYPAALARLVPDRTYTRRQIAEELFGLSYVGSKPKRENVMTNVFGVLQTADDKLLVRGINLFRRVTPDGWQMVSGMKVWERESDQWAPAPAALALGESYRSSPTNLRWKQLLAEQLARYEPRTRVLLHVLCHGGELRFETSAFFGGASQRASISGFETCRPFDDNGAAFNTLLLRYGDVAVGPWWRQDIEDFGHELSEEFSLEGAARLVPSTNYIASAMKAAMSVFRALEILYERAGIWKVDTDILSRHLSPEVTNDLLGTTQVRPDLSDEWKQLAHVLSTITDAQGYVVASEAAERWGEVADLPVSERTAAFDRLLRRGIFEEHVQILDRHPGQPRMGRGLFDDDNMRMICLRVLI